MIYIHDSAAMFPEVMTIRPLSCLSGNDQAARQPSQLLITLSFINLSLVLIMVLTHRGI